MVMRIAAIVALLIVGWQATVFFMNRNGNSTPTQLEVTDSLQARALLVADSSDSLKIDTLKAGHNNLDTVLQKSLPLPAGSIDTKGATPQQIVAFAKTLIGVPYLYGSTDPAKGFDCSGFITYVFKNFDVVVPRSSIDFTAVGQEVSALEAKEGDLVLFTGTDSSEHFVGHMGIVVENRDTLRFIHSTSGKQHGVTITPLNKYYQGRYVKTIRVFR